MEPVRCAITLNQINKPAERMVIIDATSHFFSEFEQVNWLSNVFRSVKLYGDNIGWWRVSNVHNSTPTNRHNNGCNLSFADLHCEPLKWKDERTIRWINREINDEPASEGGNPDAQNMADLLGKQL